MNEDNLSLGIAAAKAGKKQEARKLLDAAIRAAPNDERTWGWFYTVCENDTERLKCLREVLRIKPDNEQAKKIYEELTRTASQPVVTQPIPAALNQTNTRYEYRTKKYSGEKQYSRDLKKMSAAGWEVVNAETIPVRRGCIAVTFWVLLCIITIGILPLIVWAFIGRRVKIVVQYRRPV